MSKLFSFSVLIFSFFSLSFNLILFILFFASKLLFLLSSALLLNASFFSYRNFLRFSLIVFLSSDHVSSFQEFYSFNCSIHVTEQSLSCFGNERLVNALKPRAKYLLSKQERCEQKTPGKLTTDLNQKREMEKKIEM